MMPQPTVITLVVPWKIERTFKEAAKKAFPKETFGLFLGTLAGARVDVDELFIPEDVTQYCTNWCCRPQAHWFEDAMDEAKEYGKESTIVGWVHSHPHTSDAFSSSDRSQSEADLDCLIKLPVSAICVVRPIGKAKKLITSMRYWGPTIPVEVLRDKKTCHNLI
jgi:proteasome lid subunit RPN8/RPN11